VSRAIRAKAYDREPTDVQGRQIWLNRPLPEQGLPEPPWPHVPETAFAAEGHWGQSIVVIPELDLVVVRTADDRDRAYRQDLGLPLAMALVTP
jgi:CubicO group peptidase (beta-lactamase class C family)